MAHWHRGQTGSPTQNLRHAAAGKKNPNQSPGNPFFLNRRLWDAGLDDSI